MQELKNCPFCGNEAQTDFIEGESYIIECYVCRAETGIKDSADQAIAAWNRRVTPPSPITANEAGELPPLPRPAAEKKPEYDMPGVLLFTERQMRDYARAALAAKTAQPSTGEVDVEAERKLFEACMKPGYLSRCTEPGYTDQYADSHTQMAWKAWLATSRTQVEGARDGYVLVPIQATKEIIVAIERAIDSQLVASGLRPLDMQRQDGELVWDAAIAATQSTEQPK